MELKQQLIIPRDVDVVWRALNDPEVLKSSLPGCDRFEAVDDQVFDMRVTAKIGPVKATFNGQISLQNLTPPPSSSLLL